MNALVTGGGGFLGGAIVRMLVARGDRVRSLSRRRYASLEALGVEQVQGDVADSTAAERACTGCDTVFHVAAKAGVGGSFRSYELANIVGTDNLLRASDTGGVRRFVYTSSPSVVFDGTDMEGVNESVPYPVRHDAHYPATKAAAERLALAANGSRLATVALRPHLIWGPGDNHLVPRILARGRAGTLRRIGDRDPVIDSTYIENAAEAHLLAADRLAPGSPVAGRVYFISNGEPVPTWDLVNKILDAGGLGPVTKRISLKTAVMLGWAGERLYGILFPDAEPPMTRFVARELATSHWFDLTAARRDLGYSPRVSIDEGLKRLAESLKR